MEKIIWYSVDLELPLDGEKVTFKPIKNDKKDSLEFHGIYIFSEDMFFIGFEDEGDFLFSNQVAFWRKYEDGKQ
jgi:hypothetical protein